MVCDITWLALLLPSSAIIIVSISMKTGSFSQYSNQHTKTCYASPLLLLLVPTLILLLVHFGFLIRISKLVMCRVKVERKEEKEEEEEENPLWNIAGELGTLFTFTLVEPLSKIMEQVAYSFPNSSFEIKPTNLTYLE